MKALFAGSFSPPTCGHLDIIRRGSALFGELVVAVLSQEGKQYALQPEKRAEMLRKITAESRTFVSNMIRMAQRPLSARISFTRSTTSSSVWRSFSSAKPANASCA